MVASPSILFTHWFAGVQRDQAQVLKQQRLMKEEQGHLARTPCFVPPADSGAAGSEKKARREAAAAAEKAAKAAAAAARWLRACRNRCEETSPVADSSLQTTLLRLGPLAPRRLCCHQHAFVPDTSPSSDGDWGPPQP